MTMLGSFASFFLHAIYESFVQFTVANKNID